MEDVCGHSGHWIAGFVFSAGRVGHSMFGEEIGDSGGDVVVSHEGFSDEDGAHTCVSEFCDVLGGCDAAFADEDSAIFDELGQSEGVSEIGFEGAQVPVVDTEEAILLMGEADDVVADADEVLHVMHFEEDCEVEFDGEDLEVDDLGGIEAFGDEEDGVGACGASFIDLVGIDDEVFAEDGQVDDLADGLEVFEFSLEVLFVGKHAEGIGAGGGIGFCDEDGVEVLAYEACAGGGLFYFGDEV